MAEKRILTTHAGSLPRPRRLTEMYAARVNGADVDPAALFAEGDRATRWVVARQRQAGIDVPSDGEQVREAFFLYLQRRLSGFGGHWDRPGPREMQDYPEWAAMRRTSLASRPMVNSYQTPEAVGAVRYLDTAENEAEIASFKAALEAEGGGFADAFITAPSPGIVAMAIRNRHYASEEDYLDALVAALRVEYEAAARHGLMLQIDAPDLALERHVTYADRPVGDFLAFVDQVIAATNRALRNVPRERVRLHVCWGNYEGPHDRDVDLRDILPSLLKADVGGFLLPFANPRHQHEISLFKEIPLAADQYLIAGVIDTQTNFVEHPEVVAERLERAAEAVGDPARVLAGTDCGFDTSAGMGRVASDVVWAKLKAMRDGADIASARLF